MPGQLLASTALFAALGLIGEAQQARFLANALAWGFVIAAFMNVSEIKPLTGDINQLQSKNASAT